MATCRSCGADIEWVTSATTGRPMPVDVGPASKGNLAVVSGRAHAYSKTDEGLHRERRVSHFATCPDAGDWRSR